MTVTPQQIRDVVPGMASWPGGGPPGTICRNCGWFPLDKDRAGKPQHCGKYFHLTGKRGAKIAPNSRACRYFEATK